MGDFSVRWRLETQLFPPFRPPKGETTASVKGHVKMILPNPFDFARFFHARESDYYPGGEGAFGESSAPGLFSLVPLNPGCRLPPAAGGREGGLEASNP